MEINWEEERNKAFGRPPTRHPYEGCNVKMDMELAIDEEATLKAGTQKWHGTPTIYFQWPGGDVSARAITEEDKHLFPTLWESFKLSQGLVELAIEGTPLQQWALLPGAICKEFLHIGFRTVEQLSACTDDVRPKLGPNQRYIKMAKDYVEGQKATGNEVAALKKQLEREQKRNAKYEEQIQHLMSRIEAVEGTRLSDVAPRGDN